MGAQGVRCRSRIAHAIIEQDRGPPVHASILAPAPVEAFEEPHPHSNSVIRYTLQFHSKSGRARQSSGWPRPRSRPCPLCQVESAEPAMLAGPGKKRNCGQICFWLFRWKVDRLQISLGMVPGNPLGLRLHYHQFLEMADFLKQKCVCL